MFISTLAILSCSIMALMAAAAPGGGHRSIEASAMCNSGELQCCNNVSNAADPGVAALLTAVGAADVNGIVGVSCTPITALAIAGTSCEATVVCCDNNSFNGVIALGCRPVNINA